jgi:hypothetical protein
MLLLNAIERQFLDAIPSYVFLMDRDMVIHDFNAASATLFNSDGEMALFERGGDALHCIRSTDHPAGCGHSVRCVSCLLRRAVRAAYDTSAAVRQGASLELRAGARSRVLHCALTASPIALGSQKLVLLVIEDISEIVALRLLLPICKYCETVRDAQECWSDLETYLHENLDGFLSHGICPSCFEGKKSEFLALVGARGEAPRADTPRKAERTGISTGFLGAREDYRS